MGWSAEERRDTWERYIKQQEFEKSAREKALGKRD